MRLQQYSAFMRIVEHESEVKVFTMLPNQQKVNLFKMDPSNIKFAMLVRHLGARSCSLIHSSA